MENIKTALTTETVKDFDQRSVAITTTTHYPNWYEGEIDFENTQSLSDKVRGDLALEMMRGAIEKGFQVFVVDSGASASFDKQLEALDINKFHEEKKGMSASRQQCFREASQRLDVKYIVWTEPEKVSFVKDCIEIAIQPLLEGKASIVVPKRERKLFEKTYPDYQVDFETMSNKSWNKMLKIFGIMSKDVEDLDSWFGPRIFINTPEVVRLFLSEYEYSQNTGISDESNRAYRPDRYTNATFNPIPGALCKHIEVASVEVPYQHPKIQTQIETDNEDFRKKRKGQWREILRTTADYCRLLVGTESHTKLVTTDASK